MGSGASTSNQQITSNEDAFVEKIAQLVTKKIQPRLPESIWNNFSLTTPISAIVEDSKLDGPLHYNNTLSKDHENDEFGLLN